jgi:hypothetical protein
VLDPAYGRTQAEVERSEAKLKRELEFIRRGSEAVRDLGFGSEDLEPGFVVGERATLGTSALPAEGHVRLMSGLECPWGIGQIPLHASCDILVARACTPVMRDRGWEASPLPTESDPNRVRSQYGRRPRKGTDLFPRPERCRSVLWRGR